jgi:hypothetical protein
LQYDFAEQEFGSHPVTTLNEAFSTRSTRRRYEAWFLRFGLADGSGAWWFRYLLLNPARAGCPRDPKGMPVQVWATWFPSQGTPHSFIQGFPLEHLHLSGKAVSPFHFQIGDNVIEENSCQGSLQVDAHSVSWDLQYRSTFHLTLSNKGWIGFTRTSHSDALFSGEITLDGASFAGSPLGFGVQGHNCGYRHRKFWAWTHAYFHRAGAPPSTLEAVVYEMPLGLVFRKAVLWHEGKQHVFRNLRDVATDRERFGWQFQCSSDDGLELEVTIDGSGPSIHALPYLRTNCKGSFTVVNNSLAKAHVRLQRRGLPVEVLQTNSGAVLEKGGEAIRPLALSPGGPPQSHTPTR